MDISVIVCSVDKQKLEEFRQNIDATIGVSWELVAVDNSKGEYSIFQAYNLGVSKASGRVLCFCHEDIFFHTKDWGKILLGYFDNNSDLGLVGNVGSHIALKGKDWRDSPHYSMHFIQKMHSESSSKANFRCLFSIGYIGNKLNDVVAVDGMLMCIRAELFNGKIRFDDVSFNGFHQYDADISFQVLNAGYRVCVSYEIVVEHLSEGSFSEAYVDSLKVLLAKWDQNLPVYKIDKKADWAYYFMKKWQESKEWCKTVERKAKRKYLRQQSFLKMYDKSALEIKDVTKELSVNLREGLISIFFAMRIFNKTVFYHLSGVFSFQKRINMPDFGRDTITLFSNLSRDNTHVNLEITQ